MAVKIYFHYDLSVLAKKLSDNIGADLKAEGRSPFDPVNISIPINHFKAWLPLQIASGSNGLVAANLKFEYLEKTLWGLLTKLAPSEAADASMLEKESMALRVLSRLLSLDQEKPGALAPFRDYLFKIKPGKGKTRYEPFPDYERRIWNLAGKMGGLLLDYEYHRKDMVKYWRKGKQETRSDMEACQAELYRQVFENADDSQLTLPQLKEMVFEQHSLQPVATGPVHFFGFSELSAFHIELLWLLGKAYEINIYQFNVCKEFWEDVTTPGEDRRLIDKNKFFEICRVNLKKSGQEEGEELILKPGLTDNPLLKAWGKPGRELIRGFSEAEERLQNEVKTYPDHPEIDNWKKDRSSLLLRVQGQVLDREPPDSETEKKRGKLKQDDSIQIAACSDIYREVETVYNSILWNMNKDTGLKSTDVTILVSDMNRYKPVIQSVFGRIDAAVPYNLSDSTAEKDSVYGQGVVSILELGNGVFSRSAMFDVIYNPCFMAAAGVAREDVEKWSDWVKELNIYRWADSSQKKEDAADSFSSDLYTWEWGLKRIRLGRIMDKDSDHFIQAPDCSVIPPVYSDLDSKNGIVLSRFTGTVERLIKRIRGLSAVRSQSPEDWSTQLRSLFETFLAIPADRKEEAAVRNGLFNTLESFSIRAKAAGLKPSYNIVREIVKGGLADIPSRLGTYGIGGVTVASIQNARPVPFQIIYLLGMDDKSFPGDSVRSTLDLRTRYRKLGDIDPRDHGLFRFMEALMAARKKLYITYVGKDLQKDEVFQPSSAVKQLLYSMNHIMTESDPFVGEVESGVKYRILNMPLHGFSERYLEKIPSFFDLYVNYSNFDRKLFNTLVNPLEKEIDNAAPQKGTRKRLQQGERISVKIRDLKNFLLNPVEGVIKYHLHLSDTDEYDPYEVTDEPFFSSFPGDYQIFQDSLSACLKHFVDKTDFDWDGIIRQVYDTKHCIGQTPDGLFKKADSDRLSADAQVAWGNSIPALSGIDENMAFGSTVSLGKSWAESALELDPVIIDVDGVEVEITGDIKNAWVCEKTGNLRSLAWKNKESEAVKKDILDEFLFQTILNCRDGLGKGVFTGACSTRRNLAAWQHQCASGEECKDFIQELIRGLLDNTRFDLLPWHAVEKILESHLKGNATIPEVLPDFKEELTDKIDSLMSDSNSGYHTMEVMGLLSCDIPDKPYEIVKQRLKVLLEMPELDLGKKNG